MVQEIFAEFHCSYSTDNKLAIFHFIADFIKKKIYCCWSNRECLLIWTAESFYIVDFLILKRLNRRFVAFKCKKLFILIFQKISVEFSVKVRQLFNFLHLKTKNSSLTFLRDGLLSFFVSSLSDSIV